MKRDGPAFLTKLAMERALPRDPDDGAKWEILRPLVFRSVVADETFVVPAGYRTDLSSVPRIPVVYWLFGGVADEEGVLHDFLYSTRKVSRKLADEVFAEAMAAMGVPAWRRGPMWLGVRLGGSRHYAPPPELEAG